jgi:sugar lactone lactonase YvrE/enterochelin esterase-like enzyme
MKTLAAFSLALAFAGVALAQKKNETEYSLTEDSKPHDGVPKGEVLKFVLEGSKIFPGTVRNVTVYVPRQYAPAKPACVWVNQDGVQNNAPVVFDNLIAKNEMPVTIYIAASPGVVKALDPAKALDRFNRSLEYDGLGGDYARFATEELLPFVEKQKTADGRAIVLSKNGNDRCIGGSSSGAICAFNAAWERPSEFRRVFSTVGTFVNLRGADRIAGLVRETEPKPLRVFLQDGDHDQNIYGGDWWMANQMMERALTFAGYEVNHAWGTGGHNNIHGAAIFPDAVRWLWKDWPKEPQAGAGSPQLQEILIPGEGWQLVSEGHKYTEGPAANASGEVFFNDIPESKTWKVALDGKVTPFIADSQKGNGQAFGPDGHLYAVATAVPQLLNYDANGAVKIFAGEIAGNDIVVAHNGNVYATHPGSGVNPSLVWLIRPNGEKQIVDKGLKYSNGIALSPDQSLLYADDSRSHWVYSYQIQPDGTLKHRQRYYHLHEPDTADDSGADGMKVDTAGRLYVATRMGIQVCDQAGRVNCIIPTPNGRVSNLEFGGADFSTIFATCGDKVFKRKVKVQGAPAFCAPSKPLPPHL